MRIQFGGMWKVHLHSDEPDKRSLSGRIFSRRVLCGWLTVLLDCALCQCCAHPVVCLVRCVLGWSIYSVYDSSFFFYRGSCVCWDNVWFLFLLRELLVFVSSLVDCCDSGTRYLWRYSSHEGVRLWSYVCFSCCGSLRLSDANDPWLWHAGSHDTTTCWRGK